MEKQNVVFREKVDRNILFELGLEKLKNSSKENKNMLQYHIYHLKVSDEYVIKGKREVEELVECLDSYI
ncbi:hypothetical protein EMN47_09015 [Prolixibacteraceae bacterium JC049]|jgi:hypothetical protein|nr:hypothetical protein [Prolixibacteraceae bacterium JC049]